MGQSADVLPFCSPSPSGLRAARRITDQADAGARLLVAGPSRSCRQRPSSNRNNPGRLCVDSVAAPSRRQRDALVSACVWDAGAFPLSPNTVSLSTALPLANPPPLFRIAKITMLPDVGDLGSGALTRRDAENSQVLATAQLPGWIRQADATRWAIGQSERFFVFGADRRLPVQRLLQTKNLMPCLARSSRPQ